MSETEFKVGEFYRIVDIGKGSTYHPNKDDYIGKIVKLLYFFGKRKNGYIGCNITFEQDFILIDKSNRKTIHRKKGDWASFYEVKLEKIIEETAKEGGAK